MRVSRRTALGTITVTVTAILLLVASIGIAAAATSSASTAVARSHQTTTTTTTTATTRATVIATAAVTTAAPTIMPPSSSPRDDSQSDSKSNMGSAGRNADHDESARSATIKNTTTTHTHTTQNKKLLQQQLNLLLLVRCLRSAHLAQPLMVPYYSAALHLSPPSVLWLGSCYSALVTLAELPSGFLSDKLGRRTTLHLAFLGFGTSLLLTALASTVLAGGGAPSTTTTAVVWGILGLAQFLRAIGSAMYSGTDMAFLYEIIKKYGDGGTTTTTSSRTKKGGVDNAVLLQVESRNVFCTTTVEALVAALGGRIAKYVGLPAIVALASIPFFTGAILSLCLHDSSSSSNSNSNDDTSSSKLTTRHNNEKMERSGDDNNNQKQEEQQQPLTTAAAAATKPPMFSRRIPFSARSSWFISPTKSSNNLSSSLASFIDDDDDDDDTQDATTTTTADADGQSRENNNTTTDDASSSPATSSMTTTTTTTTNLVQKLFQQFRDNVPQRLWTLFFVGVVLNCGTYVASTSLNPLLWKLVGIPLEQFGTLYAGCGAISAVGALLAPSIRKILSPTMAASTNKDRNGGTERLLSFMLCTSALAYGLMALSTFCHTGMRFFMAATPSSTTSTTTTTATCTSIGSAVVASLLLSLVRGLAWPVLGSAINASVENNNSRATTLSMFSGSVKIGMVLTGIVLGGIFKKTTNSASSTAGTMSPLMIGKGLLQGCGVCGIVLVCTAVWLASVGLPKSSASSSSSSTTSSSTAPNNGDHATPQKAKVE